MSGIVKTTMSKKVNTMIFDEFRVTMTTAGSLKTFIYNPNEKKTQTKNSKQKIKLFDSKKMTTDINHD